MIRELVSIVIPTYNGEKWLGDCLKSISVQKVPHEVIVVDDLSTDRTVEIAQKSGARVIVNDVHKGQVAGKNTGIHEMNGEFFLTIDQDDRLKPDALQTLLEELNNNNAQIVMAKLVDFWDTPADQPFCHKEPFRGILTGAAIFRREIFNVIGLFDESIITGDVIDLTDRCNKNGVIIFRSDRITCERRIHSSNYGRTNQMEEYKDYAKLLKKRFLERTGIERSGKN